MTPLGSYPPVVDWIASAAFVGLFPTLGYVAYQLWLGRQERVRRAKTLHSRLPPEYHFVGQPLKRRLIVYVLCMVTAIPLGLGFGALGAALGILVVAQPFAVVAWRRREEREREVIATVRASAPTLSDGELDRLVEALEAEHGYQQMKALRELVEERAARAYAGW